jgi:hypothetical protein
MYPRALVGALGYSTFIANPAPFKAGKQLTTESRLL